jgi:group I intron endonuclease
LKKKAKKVYDADSAIISSLKRAFSRSPIVKEMMDAVRSEEVWYKKDGTPAATPRVLFECAHCNGKFMRKHTQCDHIEPVIPLEIPAKHMDLGMICFRLFCEKDRLQILCKTCHNEKSKKENEIRREWKKKEKHIVYITTNMKNCKMYIGVHRCVDLDDEYLGSGVNIKKAIVKYGKENFIRHVLFVYDNAEDAYKKEADIVGDFVVEGDEYYNLAHGGRVPTMTDEIKEKISQSNKGRALGDKNPMYGKTHTKESVEKIKNRHYPSKGSHKGSRKVVCIETQEVFDSIAETGVKHIGRAIKNNLSAGGYHWDYVEDYNDDKEYNSPIKKLRRVRCLETGMEFESLDEAARSIGVARGSKIGDVCRKKRKKAHGYTWEYIDTENKN